LPKRKNVTWRIADNPQNDLINDWLDQQKNIQDSITNIVLHMIDRFGIQNITDYDIQKILYQELLIEPRAQQQANEKKAEVLEKDKRKKETNKISSEAKKDDSEQDTDDMYSELDIDNL